METTLEEGKEKPKILIVEDDESIAKLLEEIAQDKGYASYALVADYPSRILEGLEKTFREFQPDAAIVDGLDHACFEVIAKIEKIKPNTLCVIYTGNAPALKVRMQEEERKHEVFQKPTLNELFNFLASYFQSR